MSQGPRLIAVVTINDQFGVRIFYAGCETQEDALIMAAQRDHVGAGVTAKIGPNKFGIQHGEWKQVAP